MGFNKHYGRAVSKKQIYALLKYLDFATTKQKLDIYKLANKDYITDAEYNRLKKYIFKYNMYMKSNSANVDARLNKIHRYSPTCTGKQSKYD